ncbi:peptidyl-prolyl cis-trans isomerase CYP59 [Brassica rapa]|nr:peptidyl-prolyl cis-trans isomerase CYP59 [Brassica rapa]XP_009106808.1 peptidyl-prolyl cis-trans isomerase CYP59 [Brassica rapa]XP_033132852.1 peptidyl-prolyl cis-trans isomerase CYP59 [Brassica rapa]
MSVLIVTSLGDIVIDLHSSKCPLTCKNFLKLCKIKYYNGCLFHTVQKDFTAQTGDPTGTGLGGDSIYKFLYGEQARFFGDEIHLDLKHSKTGTVAMASAGENLNASQFYFTLRDDLDYLDGKHTVFGEIAEGLDTLTRINEAYVDAKNRPYKNIRIKHTYILEDPFEDPTQLADMIPDASPEGKPKEEVEVDVRLEDDWVPMDEQLGAHELEEIIRAKAAHSSAVVLESIGDIPEAEVKPPENVLFVCKLNPVTEDEDLHTIFSRFGTVISADVIRDFKTGDSLCYAFIEFEEKAACEQAYNKMDNALIDDRRIHVDFSQSVSKLWSQFRQKDSQKGKGNGCFKCGSTDHVAKDCVGGGNQASKFIVKDQNRQHGGGEGYDMVFEGDIAERPKREKSHDKDKIRRRSPHGYGEGKRQDRDEGRSPGGYDEGKRRDKDEGRSGRVYGEGKRRDRDEGDTEDKAASKYDGRRDDREDVRERDRRYDDGVSREKKQRERNERESREDEERRRRRRHEEMRDDRWSDKGRRRERRDR